MISVVIVIIATLLLSAFFSGTEMAFVTANKLRVELDKKKGLLTGKILSIFYQKTSFFIASILVGNNIALVVYGIFMAALSEPFISRYLPVSHQNDISILFIQTIIATFVILFTAEFIPKNLFRLRPNNILSFFAVIILFFYILLYPITYIAIKASDIIIVHLLGIKSEDNKYVFSPVDVDNYLRDFAQHENINLNIKSDIQIFQNARDLPNIKIRECMVPRPEIIAIEKNDSINNLKHKFIDNGLSKILVFDSSIDNIIGYVHNFDMFSKPKSVKAILRPVIIVPESMTADVLLKTFIEDNKHIAVVVDEFGGTSGMVTIEDVVEEIFGEINDEYDDEEFVEHKASDKEFHFSGRIEIDFINEKYNLDLPVADEYETLAGLIIYHHKSIPNRGEEIKMPPFTFIISEVSDTKIEQVILKIDH